MVRHSSLDAVLRERAELQPDSLAYAFLGQGETEQARMTYAELDRAARAVAACLQERCRSGDRVLLLYPPGLDFVAAFMGCLYAGVVAVPVYSPGSPRRLPRLLAIVHDAGAALILATQAVQAFMARAPELASVPVIATDTLPPGLEDTWREEACGHDTLAFLQYTSGSTSAPKGVMVSHGNILCNEHAIQTAFGNSSETVKVSWLPVYHDMGLIDGVLQPLYGGFPSYLMSPLDFLQKPIRWLSAIARYRATNSGGPNFAYELCVRKTTPEQRAELDLSSLRVLYNGAEPIRLDTLTRFSETFAPCGFRSEAFYPCYGLAESTLFMTGGSTGDPVRSRMVDLEALGRNEVVERPQGGVSLVGVGHTWLDHRVVIVDPETCLALPDGRVGEIWMSGPSIAQGYWNHPEKTQETFRARLADTGEGPFLRTGDLGFRDAQEVYVTGRLKDLLIIRGSNYYPQDIERAVEEAHPAIRRGCTAAFTLQIEGEERLVVVAEVERRLSEERLDSAGNREAMAERLDSFERATSPLDVRAVLGLVRAAVSEQYQLNVHEVVLVKATSIPKTSSGKIQRHACRTGYRAGTLQTVETP